MAGGNRGWAAGYTVTYGELEARSNRLAHLFRAQGLMVGDHVAVLAENHPRYLEACWGADRTGLYYTTVNSHLTPDEVAYIVGDSGARVLITSPALQAVAAVAAVQCPRVERTLVFGEDGAPPPPPGFERYEDALAAHPPTRVADENVGLGMLYSSGTTGKPKGVVRPLPGIHPDDVHPFETMLHALYGYDDTSVYLSPAPLYHAAPLGFCMTVLRLGGTVVVMERFDPVDFLRLVDEYQVTHTQCVPTMFVRMLKLPREVRERFDLSSLRSCVHAAAPCAVEIKQQIIDWWKPRGVHVAEYYGGTEINGLTYITDDEWLLHRGSVGRALLGRIRILDEELQEVPTGDIGTVYFADGGAFAYHNDPQKTAEADDGTGSTTIGDIGYVDDEGYLYLTDRKAFTIISGGVTIYPQEAEDALITHPAVADVAVFGVPDADLGERVHAVVQPAAGAAPGAELERELIAHCEARLARYKCPRSIDFDASLPRLDTGKLYKRELRDRYWSRA
jgi:acyl-CoA synthetase (AMP-forming)/AMP-acid ligase II